MKWFLIDLLNMYAYVMERRPALYVLFKLEWSITRTNQPAPCIVTLVYFTVEEDGVDYEMKDRDFDFKTSMNRFSYLLVLQEILLECNLYLIRGSLRWNMPFKWLILLLFSGKRTGLVRNSIDVDVRDEQAHVAHLSSM